MVFEGGATVMSSPCFCSAVLHDSSWVRVRVRARARARVRIRVRAS